MKTEYILTVAERAELADIDRQIAELCKRKSEIYLRSNVRYITETPEEVEAVRRMDYWPLCGTRPLVPKECIAKMIFDGEKEVEG